MFTYIPEDRTLLTCDAFGCHYSEFDAKGIDGEGYLESAKLYYDCIVKPYAKFVLDAVDKVVELKLDFDTILTSHGPILSQRPMEQVARYVEWSKTDVYKRQDRAKLFSSKGSSSILNFFIQSSICSSLKYLAQS